MGADMAFYVSYMCVMRGMGSVYRLKRLGWLSMSSKVFR
jgi:hypothetical protein